MTILNNNPNPGSHDEPDNDLSWLTDFEPEAKADDTQPAEEVNSKPVDTRTSKQGKTIPEIDAFIESSMSTNRAGNSLAGENASEHAEALIPKLLKEKGELDIDRVQRVRNAVVATARQLGLIGTDGGYLLGAASKGIGIVTIVLSVSVMLIETPQTASWAKTVIAENMPWMPSPSIAAWLAAIVINGITTGLAFLAGVWLKNGYVAARAAKAKSAANTAAGNHATITTNGAYTGGVIAAIGASVAATWTLTTRMSTETGSETGARAWMMLAIFGWVATITIIGLEFLAHRPKGTEGVNSENDDVVIYSTHAQDKRSRLDIPLEINSLNIGIQRSNLKHLQNLVTPARQADEPLILERINAKIAEVQNEIDRLIAEGEKISKDFVPLDLVAKAQEMFGKSKPNPTEGAAA